MNTKQNCWILFSTLICFSGHASPIQGEPRLIGVPSFGNGSTITSPWQTDANTSTRVAWTPQCCSPLENTAKYAITQMGFLTGPAQSSIWIDVANHFYSDGRPMPHSLRFRWDVSVDPGNYIVCEVNGVNVTNSSFLPTWTDVNLYIPARVGTTIRLKWTVVDINSNFGSDGACLDAVKWVPINTNAGPFMISNNTSNTLLLSWATNYIGYTLVSKTNLTNAWQVDNTRIVFTNNSYRAVVTNIASIPRRFYKLRVP